MTSASKEKRLATAATVLPANCHFFLADDIRIEQNGKPSLIGFYPDSVIVVQLPSSAPEPTKEKPIGIAGIAILANFLGAHGEYDAEVEMNGPGRVVLVRSDRQKMTAGKQNMNFIARFVPLPVVGFGKYEVVIKLHGRPYNFEFEVRRGELDPQQSGLLRFGSLLEKAPTSRAKKARKAK